MNHGFTRVLFLTAMSASLSFFPAAAFAQASKAVVGTWTLVKNTSTDASGKTTLTYGDKPMGQVSFTPDGRYTLIITRADLPKFAGNNRLKGTDTEKAAVNDGVIAHFGKYTVKDKDIILQIESSTFPNWNGTEQKRTFTVNGNELRWSNAAASGGGIAELVWKKL